ncbi:YopX protein [anaerobic digester metagenome]
MREILFRGKRVDNGEWVEGQLLINKSAYMETVHIVLKYGEMLEVIPETVGQYTGLDDKNGVKIFEGGLICDDGHHLIGVVEYETCYGGFWYYDRNRFGTALHFDDFGELTVIGNIHDNPELMEEQYENS